MNAIFDIFRKRPDESEGRREKFALACEPGDTLLDVFHRIQAERDPSFSYRYSCRGAICGSCAVRINGVAGLACKTQVADLAAKGEIVIDPLGNLKPVKDLVPSFVDFWEAFEKVKPAIHRRHETHDLTYTWEDKLDARQTDQMDRVYYCIRCASCFSDCPKRTEDPRFIGPAASVALFKFYFDPRDDAHAQRVRLAAEPVSGVVACDAHANCVKVCPKDVRPLRAITFIRKDLPAQE